MLDAIHIARDALRELSQHPEFADNAAEFNEGGIGYEACRALDREIDRVKSRTWEERFKLVQKMEQHGGGFVQALAKAYYVADDSNREILYESFAFYFDQYERWLER